MSPRTKEQFEEIRQKSMQAIKEAALELFAHKGYFSTSISQIAKEAGVSKGLLYNYFENKEALLEYIIMEVVNMGEEMMTALVKSEVSPAEKLREITAFSFELVQGNIHYWKLLTSLAFQTDALESLMPMLKQKQQLMMDAMTQLFDEMGCERPEEEAFLYGAVMDGVMLHFMQMDNYPVEKMKAYILNKFIKD